MKSTKAIAAMLPREELKPFVFARRDVGAHDVGIEIDYCGVCHSDIHQARDEWGPGIFPMVPGHEISGRVASVGKLVTRFKVGERVGVGCFVDSCRVCASCKEGLEQYCDEGAVFTYNGLERDRKTPTYGGYSQFTVVDEHYVVKIPENLDPAAAAPLLCAGITVFSPLKFWKAGPGKRVGVLGLGGLGHMAVKIANAMGSEVTVLSHSDRKREDALRLGAMRFCVTKDETDLKQYRSYFDIIINTVSADIDWNSYLGLLRRDGAMIVVGIPEKMVPVHAFSLVGGRKVLTGSAIGGIAETQEMLDFCGKHSIVSDIELIKASEINNAYERVIKSDVRYRFVIDIKSLT